MIFLKYIFYVIQVIITLRNFIFKTEVRRIKTSLLSLDISFGVVVPSRKKPY